MAQNYQRGFFDRVFRNPFIRFAMSVYFRRIVSAGCANLPGEGPVVIVCNHRNGAIDGGIVKSVLPNAFFIVGKNLTQSFFLRFFFGGQIDVHRKSNGENERRENRNQIVQASQSTCADMPVVVFPEGTSKLGPSLLTLKSGVYYLCRTIWEIRQDERPVYVVPIGLHYEKGWAFRSVVFVTVGKPWMICDADLQEVPTFMDEIKRRLLAVTIPYADQDEQARAETFADLASHYTSLSHEEACRLYVEKSLPENIRDKFQCLYAELGSPCRRRMPLVFEGNIAGGIVTTAILTLLILAVWGLNVIPCLTAFVAARIMADDNNVITLWRCLVGFPLLLLQWVTYVVLLIYTGKPAVILGGIILYSVLTVVGVRAFHAWKCLVVKIMNHSAFQKEDILGFVKGLRQWQKMTG